jgi:hypothetical protein
VKRKTYYAHAKCIYGHPHEKKELAAIRRRLKGTQIVNPARYDGLPEKRKDTLGFCFRLIDKVDVLVYSRLLGKITAGVGAEVNYALRLKKPVYQLREGNLVRQSRPVKYETISRTISLYDQWKEKYLC